MTICFSLTNLELGGAQVFVVRLANYLAEKHQRPIYIYDHWPEFRKPHTLHNLHPLVKILSYSENSLERWCIWKINAVLRLLNPSSQFRYDLNKKRMEKLLNKHKVTLVNSHMSYSDFVLSTSVLPPGCNLVITLHGEYELLLKESGNDPEKPRNIRQAIQKTSALIYTAEKNLATAQKLEDLSNIKKQKINIGFDPSLFPKKAIARNELGLEKDDLVAGMVSRGFAEKGWDTAIAAVQLYNRKAVKKMVLFCIGNGDYLRDLVEKTADPMIRLKQFDKNYEDYFYCYPLFDLFIFPTRFEGESVPNVLIECLYWKIPVIASRHAEIPVMLQCGTDKAAGICVPLDTQDTPKEFAAVLGDLAINTHKRRELSANSEQAFQAFSMRAVASEYEKMFASVNRMSHSETAR